MQTQYFRTPFANNGDKTQVPQDVQANGTISWPTGWGPIYEKDLETDPDAKPIDRLNMNQLLYVITRGMQFLQTSMAPEWIDAAGNGGTSFPYPIGAVVNYNGGLWASIVSSNTATPGSNAAAWVPFMYRPASASEALAASGSYPMLPAQVKAMIDLNKQTVPDASTTQKGIVQLSDALIGESGSRAATEYAVGLKLTQVRTTLGTDNIGALFSVFDRGVYFQNVDARATVANGYPEGATAGVLMVLGEVSGAPMQTYTSSSGRTWTRVRNNASTAWNPWIETGYRPPQASTSQVGVVQLSDALIGESGSRAATEYAVGLKLTQVPTALGTDNIGALSSPFDKGIYFQNVDARATVANGYPEGATAGVLLVLGEVSGAPMQTYTSSMGRLWTRVRNNASTAWNAWREIGANQGVAGAVVMFALAPGAAAPSNHLICNGAAVSRSSFPRLFAAIGTRFGAGDGSTTFNLPNVPAGFSLVANNGRGTDDYSTLGAVIAHNHTASSSSAGLHSHAASGTALENGAHNHTADKAPSSNNTAGNAASPANAGGTSLSTTTNGAHTHNLSVTVDSSGAHVHAITVDTAGSAANFPAGVYTLACISY